MEINNIIDAQKFLADLSAGAIRAASVDEEGNWKTNLWVKQGILSCFRMSTIVPMGFDKLPFADKGIFTLQIPNAEKMIRIVPGGSSIRQGAYIGNRVVLMPPSYVNVGAYVDDDTLIDSHALVGSCAQIGKRVHLSAAAQIGGVLEPIGQRPVVVEDDVFIGGNTGIYEGILVRKRAVIAAGVILTGSSKIYDLVHERIISRDAQGLLEVPEGAVVVPGTRKIGGAFAEQNGLNICTPIIVKYRDDKTDSKAALESSLR